MRAIGRWGLTALAVNTIVGSGIFGLPSLLAGSLGRASVLGMLLGGLASGVILACFAEVASYFTVAGGPYLYAKVAFGRFTGLQAGWMFWLSRLAAPAANANLFVVYLGEFWPHAKDPLPRLIILTVLVWGLAAINLRGVRGGAQVSTVFTVAKLLPLLTVGIAGAWFLLKHGSIADVPALAPGPGAWLQAGLLMIFAYGGYEAALTPASEAKNPRRDAVFALFAAGALSIVIYTLTQWVALGTVHDLAHSARPLADAARIILGSTGARLVAIGALISVSGNLAANMVVVPRITFALAQQRDFPSIFAAVHSRFRTPYFSILVFALLTWGLAISGSFAWNVGLSAFARLFYYVAGCVALPVLRKKMPGGALFRLPGGPWFSMIGVIICGALFTRVDFGGSLILLGTILAATLNWLVVRGNKPTAV